MPDEVRIPEPVQPPAYYESVPVEEEEVVEAPAPDGDDREEMSDLTSLDDEDRQHLFGTEGTTNIEEPEDLSDLVDVSDEDIMGEKPEPQPQPRYRIAPRGKRFIRRESPPTSIGGVQY